MGRTWKFLSPELLKIDVPSPLASIPDNANLEEKRSQALQQQAQTNDDESQVNDNADKDYTNMIGKSKNNRSK